MLCVVTVGTTAFDSLIDVILSPDTLEALSSAGYTSLIVQAGQSSHSTAPAIAVTSSPLKLSVHASIDNIDDLLSRAQLVIAHAGAGSVLTALRAHTILIVVPNPTLTDNHQAELALQLSQDRLAHVVWNPGHLVALLRSSLPPLESIPPYSPRFNDLVISHLTSTS